MQQSDPLFAEATPLERERMTTIATRRALFAAQRQAIELMERDNERQAGELVATVQARINAKAAAQAGDAEVVELRPGGPVEVGPAAA